jgi:hypothetical protein
MIPCGRTFLRRGACPLIKIEPADAAEVGNAVCVRRDRTYDRVIDARTGTYIE